LPALKYFDGTVATVGFPDIGLQGFAPKVLAHGHHGENRHWEVELRPGDDPRYFQISVVLADGHHAAGQFGRSLEFRLQAASPPPPKGGTPNVMSAKVLAHGHHASVALAATGSLPES